MATTQPQQSFVAQNFDSGEVKSQAAATSNVASTPQEFSQQVASAAGAISHGIVVTSQNVSPSHHQTSLPVNTVTLTVQPSQIQAPQATIQPQIITANVISGDEFQAKEGILQCQIHAIVVANFGPKRWTCARSIPRLIASFYPCVDTYLVVLY